MSGFRNYIFILVVVVFSVGYISQNTGTPHLILNDISPRFAKFFDSANRIQATEPERWQLWKSMYDFAATPPTAAGDSIARRLLDSAWPKYPAMISTIGPGTSREIFNDAKTVAEKISGLLKPDRAFDITLRIYVGGFETNAFTTAFNNKITTSIPIEIPSETRRALMVHELVHAVHIGMGSFTGGWKRTIGTIVLTEGLAMRASQAIDPGKPDSAYTEYSPGWLSAATKRNDDLLRDVLNKLYSDNDGDIMNFTMGRGPSGFEREAYYAGWMVVGYWLRHGRTFSEIAHIREGAMPDEVSSTIRLMLKKG